MFMVPSNNNTQAVLLRHTSISLYMPRTLHQGLVLNIYHVCHYTATAQHVVVTPREPTCVWSMSVIPCSYWTTWCRQPYPGIVPSKALTFSKRHACRFGFDVLCVTQLSQTRTIRVSFLSETAVCHTAAEKKRHACHFGFLPSLKMVV